MVNRLFLSIVSLLLVALASLARAATPEPYIELSISSEQVYEGDTVLLEIRSSGLLDPLELDVLSEDARFERETTGTMIEVRDGKVVDINLRRMVFTPMRNGTIVFGPITAGEVVSNSVSIHVVEKQILDWHPDDNDLAIEIDIQPETASIHQLQIMNIRLWHRYPIADEQIDGIGPPAIPHRIVYEKRRTNSTDDEGNLRYQIAWRYLLFADTITHWQTQPVKWQGLMIKSRLERAEFVREHAPVVVRTQPAREVMNWWLPAQGLDISESWSSPPTSLKAGDELTRSITLKAQGITAAALPEPVVPESRALRQQLINTTREEQVDDNGLVASARFDYRIRAISPIPAFMDTVRVPWWDTTSHSLKEVILPARRINIGIPERAALKQNIINQERWFKRWYLSTRDIAARYSGFNQAMFVLAACFALLTLSSYLPGNLPARYRRWQQQRGLQQLLVSNQWQALYARLLKLENSENPYPEQGLSPLARCLYGRAAPATPTASERAHLQSCIKHLGSAP